MTVTDPATTTAVAATDATLADAIAEHDGTVLVDYWATWCGPCKALSPILAGIAATHPHVRVLTVDVDQNPRSAADAQITSVPTIEVYAGGTRVHQIVGALPRTALLARLAPWL